MIGFLKTGAAMILSPPSADLHERVGLERIFGDRQIERRGTAADAPGGVVFRTVARAEPAAVLAARLRRLLALRHAAEMGAHADHDQPFGLLDPLLVGLRICLLYTSDAADERSSVDL